MQTVIAYFGVIGMCVMLGYFWVLYLIRIVMTEEEVKDKIVRIQRMLEEKARAKDDQSRKRQVAAERELDEARERRGEDYTRKQDADEQKRLESEAEEEAR